MKYFLTILIAMFLVGCGELTTKQIVDKNLNGIVLITNQIDASNGGVGTGFILEDNMIVTNHHVIEGNGELHVYLPSSSKKYEASVVYFDKISDIAVIRVKDWEKFKEEQKPTNLTLGNSDLLESGDKIVVIGHPWGLTWSVSEGIISAKSRKLDTHPKYLDQVDAKLYQGNSGGPIFNEDGEIVCVSNMMLSKEGGSYGFCIPSTLVKKVLHDFNTSKEVRWRALNVQIDSSEGEGVTVKAVESGGAADKAGIKENDKILKIYTSRYPDGMDVNAANDIIVELASLNGDEEMVKVLVSREGQELLLDVKTNYKTAKDY